MGVARSDFVGFRYGATSMAPGMTWEWIDRARAISSDYVHWGIPGGKN